MTFDSPCLKGVSDSASLIAGSNLFQIYELKLIDDQWLHLLLAVDLRICPYWCFFVFVCLLVYLMINMGVDQVC